MVSLCFFKHAAQSFVFAYVSFTFTFYSRWAKDENLMLLSSPCWLNNARPKSPQVAPRGPVLHIIPRRSRIPPASAIWSHPMTGGAEAFSLSSGERRSFTHTSRPSAAAAAAAAYCRHISFTSSFSFLVLKGDNGCWARRRGKTIEWLCFCRWKPRSCYGLYSSSSSSSRRSEKNYICVRWDEGLLGKRRQEGGREGGGSCSSQGFFFPILYPFSHHFCSYWISVAPPWRIESTKVSLVLQETGCWTVCFIFQFSSKSKWLILKNFNTIFLHMPMQEILRSRVNRIF